MCACHDLVKYHSQCDLSMTPTRPGEMGGGLTNQRLNSLAVNQPRL